MGQSRSISVSRPGLSRGTVPTDPCFALHGPTDSNHRTNLNKRERERERLMKRTQFRGKAVRFHKLDVFSRTSFCTTCFKSQNSEGPQSKLSTQGGQFCKLELQAAGGFQPLYVPTASAHYRLNRASKHQPHKIQDKCTLSISSLRTTVGLLTI